MEIDSTIAWSVLILSLIGHVLLLLIGNSLIFADPDRLDQTASKNSVRLSGGRPKHDSAFLFFRVLFLFIAAFILFKSLGISVFENDYLGILIFAAYIWLSNFLVEIILMFNANVISRISSGIPKFIYNFFDFLVNLNRYVLNFFFRSKYLINHDNSDNNLSEVSVAVDSEDTKIAEYEIEMIRGVVRLDRIMAREIMVPRVDMEALLIDTPLKEIAKKMVESGHSRIPVFDPDLDHVKGVVYARDVLLQFNNGDQIEKKISSQNIRPALFIPETKSLSELLSEFKDLRVHIAIVVDEYGGVSGLLTIDDLLEEIVGDIQDEFDLDSPEFEVISNKEFFINAQMTIEKLAEISGVLIKGDGFDTVAGFVYSKLGRIPSVNDFVELNGVSIEVVETVGRRIKRLKITGDFSQTPTKKRSG